MFRKKGIAISLILCLMLASCTVTKQVTLDSEKHISANASSSISYPGVTDNIEKQEESKTVSDNSTDYKVESKTEKEEESEGQQDYSYIAQTNPDSALSQREESIEPVEPNNPVGLELHEPEQTEVSETSSHITFESNAEPFVATEVAIRDEIDSKSTITVTGLQNSKQETLWKDSLSSCSAELETQSNTQKEKSTQTEILSNPTPITSITETELPYFTQEIPENDSFFIRMDSSTNGFTDEIEYETNIVDQSNLDNSKSADLSTYSATTTSQARPMHEADSTSELITTLPTIGESKSNINKKTQSNEPQPVILETALEEKQKNTFNTIIENIYGTEWNPSLLIFLLMSLFVYSVPPMVMKKKVNRISWKSFAIYLFIEAVVLVAARLLFSIKLLTIPLGCLISFLILANNHKKTKKNYHSIDDKDISLQEQQKNGNHNVEEVSKIILEEPYNSLSDGIDFIIIRNQAPCIEQEPKPVKNTEDTRSNEEIESISETDFREEEAINFEVTKTEGDSFPEEYSDTIQEKSISIEKIENEDEQKNTEDTRSNEEIESVSETDFREEEAINFEVTKTEGDSFPEEYSDTIQEKSISIEKIENEDEQKNTEDTRSNEEIESVSETDFREEEAINFEVTKTEGDSFPEEHSDTIQEKSISIEKKENEDEKNNEKSQDVADSEPETFCEEDQEEKLEPVKIGLDFGTSFTKAFYIVDANTQGPVRWENGSLFKASVVYQSGDNLYYYEKQVPKDSAIVKDFKYTMVCNLVSHQTEETANESERREAELQSVFFLANLLRYVKRMLKNSYCEDFSLYITMGIPADRINKDEELKTRYQRVLDAAYKLSISKIEEIAIMKLETIYSYIDRADSKSNAHSVLFPELMAELQYIINSSQFDYGNYLIIDIGGGTADSALIQKYGNSNETSYSNCRCLVLPIGNEKRKQLFGKNNSKEKVVERFEMNKQIFPKSSISTWRQTDEVVCRLYSHASINQDEKNRYLTERLKINAFYKKVNTIFSDPISTIGTNGKYTCLVFGGGCRNEWYMDRFIANAKALEKSTKRKYSAIRRINYANNDFSLNEEEKESIDRLIIAYQLAVQSNKINSTFNLYMEKAEIQQPRKDYDTYLEEINRNKYGV
ncbi:MAG: hypothetical protein WC117_06200 [Sphaerochaetaceae bacterium]